MSLGLGSSLGKTGLTSAGIVTNGLTIKHNYAAGSVVPLSDGAVYFDGTDDYIDLGSKATSGDDATVSAWIYLLDNGVNTILKYGDMQVKMQDDTSLLTYPDGGGTASDVTVSSGLNEWNHICSVIDDNVVKVYYNGILIETDSGTGTLSTDIVASYIGRDASSNYFKGYICNVGFWSRTMEIAEVKSIMNKNYAGLTSSETTGLVSWWNLSENANDSTGTNNGTLS